MGSVRRSAHKLLGEVLARCELRSRWLLLKSLCIGCTTDALLGVYLDFIKATTVAHWNEPEANSGENPFTSFHVADLVRSRLRIAASSTSEIESLGAILSILRFLLLRDGKHEASRTGTWSAESVREIRDSLTAILAREEAERLNLSIIEANQREALVEHPTRIALGILQRSWPSERVQILPPDLSEPMDVLLDGNKGEADEERKD